MTKNDREKSLYKLGAKKVVFLDFEKVKDITPEDFLDYIYREFRPDLILCGYDFRFGKNAAGNIKLLEKYCRLKDISFIAKPAVFYELEPVSSTSIRKFISDGNIEKANKLTYKKFGFASTVISGDKRGRTLGFPTINQEFPSELITPKLGVYASEVLIDRKEYKSITNIGFRPTYKTDAISCETHIFDFNKDLYGREITLHFLKFIREEVKFKNASQLIDSINNDIKTAKSFFNIIQKGDWYEVNGQKNDSSFFVCFYYVSIRL